jgi:hypothetical protein
MRGLAAQAELRALGINFIFLLRCLVTVHRHNCSFSKLPHSWAENSEEIEASWRQTEKAVHATIDFVRDKVGWTTRRWLPSTMALIPIVYMLAKSRKHDFSSTDTKSVKHYLLITGLRSVFRGATETAVNFYVNAIRDHVDSETLARVLDERIPKNRQYPISKEDIRSTTGMYSSLMQIYLVYLLDRGAKSWPSLRALDDILRQGLTGDPLAVHHVFPKQFMLDLDYPLQRLDTVANYAILSQADNSELGDRNPLDVWRGLTSEQKECASKQLCFLAADNFLRPEAYEEFVDYRAGKMSEQLNGYLSLGRAAQASGA